MSDLTSRLTDRNEEAAYALTRQIAAASETSSEYYPALEEFASLLGHEKTYVRTRAFILCCCQARWDTEGRLLGFLPELLTLLHDPKPTVVRQCLNALQKVVTYRPELRGAIARELETIDLSRYRDSMAPLIRKDIDVVKALLHEGEQNG